MFCRIYISADKILTPEEMYHHCIWKCGLCFGSADACEEVRRSGKGNRHGIADIMDLIYNMVATEKHLF